MEFNVNPASCYKPSDDVVARRSWKIILVPCIRDRGIEDEILYLNDTGKTDMERLVKGGRSKMSSSSLAEESRRGG